MKKAYLYIFAAVFLIITLLSTLHKQSFGKYEAYAPYAPNYALANFPRHTLLYSQSAVSEILSKHKQLRAHHVSGIIVTTVSANWFDEELPTKKIQHECQRLNHLFPDSYLSTNLIPPTIATMPNWDDISGWATINARILAISQFARNAGFKGLLLDTQDRNTLFWCPEENPRYKDISDEFASKVIYQRSREMIQTIDTGFPNAQILINPVGCISPEKTYSDIPKYLYWVHFANGLMSTRHGPGIAFVVDSYTDILTTANIEERLTADYATLNMLLDEKQYWQEKGSLSFILKEKDTTENIETQLHLFQKYATGYIIVHEQTPLTCIAPLYDVGLKSYYTYVLTGKKPLWIVYQWQRLIHSIKDHWHELF